MFAMQKTNFYFLVERRKNKHKQGLSHNLVFRKKNSQISNLNIYW